MTIIDAAPLDRSWEPEPSAGRSRLLLAPANQVFRIEGGRPLAGQVTAGGAKNSALPMLAACILADETVWLEGVPELTDVGTQRKVLGRLGVETTRLPDGRLRVRTVDSRPVRAPYDLVRRMRASFCVLGPLLARRGRAEVSLPGGCQIGDRPVELHLRGLTALGAQFQVRHGYVLGTATRLVGATLQLTGPRGPSVTGTANCLSAAVLAEGETTIHGAATEPEIVDLGRFLNALGARIEGLGTSTLRIEGVRQLGGARYRIIPDRIEAATLLVAAAITGGRVTVRGIAAEHLSAVLEMLDAAGASLASGRDWVSAQAPTRRRPIRVTAQAYPGFPTDLQSQSMALAAISPGRSSIRDLVFSDRFAHVPELNRLGARIERCGDTALVEGVPQLSGAEVTASDLRASAALVLAGLAAQGQTVVRRIQHLDRGYDRLEQKLASLGAHIRRESATGR